MVIMQPTILLIRIKSNKGWEDALKLSHSYTKVIWLPFLGMEWEWEGDSFSVALEGIFHIIDLIYDFEVSFL